MHLGLQVDGTIEESYVQTLLWQFGILHTIRYTHTHALAPQQEDPYLPASPSAAIAQGGRLIASKSGIENASGQEQ